MTDHALFKQLQQARISQGLSQQSLSEKLGLAQSYLSQVEAGKINLGLSNFQEIAHALGLDLLLMTKQQAYLVKALLAGESSQLRWQPDNDPEDLGGISGRDELS